MMEGAHRPGSSPAARARRGLADPHAVAENRENGETAENAETLHRAPTASAPETLKHETAAASHGRAETVKHAPGQASRIALRIARETVKQSRKTQSGEDLTCFTPHGPAHPPETVLHQTDTACETLKHPSVPVSGTAWDGTREFPKTVKIAETLKSAGMPVPPCAGPARGRRRPPPFLLSCPDDHGRVG